MGFHRKFFPPFNRVIARYDYNQQTETMKHSESCRVELKDGLNRLVLILEVLPASLVASAEHVQTSETVQEQFITETRARIFHHMMHNL